MIRTIVRHAWECRNIFASSLVKGRKIIEKFIRKFQGKLKLHGGGEKICFSVYGKSGNFKHELY